MNMQPIIKVWPGDRQVEFTGRWVKQYSPPHRRKVLLPVYGDGVGDDIVIPEYAREIPSVMARLCAWLRRVWCR